MKSALSITAALLFTATLVATSAENELSPREKSEGWTLLFDGKTFQGWHAIGRAEFPSDKWVISEGWLYCPGKGGGDIVSEKVFDQFELSWEWKLEQGGNSGVKYFVDESRGPIGHEYQLLDDERHPDGKLGQGKRVTGSFYDVLKPQVKTALGKPMEINKSRILVRNNQVEHWLNGTRVLQYELGSPELLAAIGNSKFKDVKGFGTRFPGHLLLQDHNNRVWFRNIKIREWKE